MLRRFVPRFVSLSVVTLVAGLACAAEPDPDAAQHQLRTVAQYPKAVREAMLELSHHPDLLKKLEPDKDLDPVLKGQPPAVANAARTVAKYPDVLKLLKDHPDALGQAAKAHADDKKKVIELLDQEEKDNDRATDEWAQRLEGDQAALDQLLKANAAYVKQPNASPMATGLSTAGDEVTIFTQPSPPFINYVMSNADVYPALFNVMVSQWLSSKNTVAYDRTFYHWWDRYQRYFHDSLLHYDVDRIHRLTELARYDRKYSDINVAHRYEKFYDHIKDYPYLGKLPRHDPNVKPLPLHHKPVEHRDRHVVGKDPHKPVHKGAHVRVHRKAPSHEHHVHHAHAGHHHHVQHHAKR
jgi:hypothetical protein